MSNTKFQEIMVKFREKIERSGLEELKEILSKISLINFYSRNHRNLKIKSINTSKNPRIGNMDEFISPDLNNLIIKGIVGTGKTTFFDKIIHFFTHTDYLKSPINQLITDINLKLSSSESDFIIQYSGNSSTNRNNIKLDDFDQENSIEELNKMGLYQNRHCFLNFISQDPMNDSLFYLNSKLNSLEISNFNQLCRDFIISEEEKEILFILKQKREYFERIYDKSQNENFRFKQELNILKKTFNSTIELIEVNKKFIENQYGIQKAVAIIRNNSTNQEKFMKRSNIKNNISGITEKIAILKEMKNSMALKKVKKVTFELYNDYEPQCPICMNIISLDEFEKRYKKNNCYLCNSPDFYYEDEIIEKINDYQNLEKIDELIESYQSNINELNQELNKIKIQNDNFKSIPDSIKKILSKFYLDVNKPDFNIKEEVKRKNHLIKNHTQFLKEQETIIKHFLKRIKENNKFIKRIDNAKLILISFVSEYSSYLDIKYQKLIYDIIDDVHEFWDLIMKDDRKTLFYDKEKDMLKLLIILKNESERDFEISNLKKVNYVSASQLNAIRYCIHFSFVKNLYRNSKSVPIKFILIDDPDNEIRENLFEVLKTVFIDEFKFQIILLSTNDIGLPKEWKIEKFSKNVSVSKIKNYYQTSLSKYFMKNRKILNDKN